MSIPYLFFKYTGRVALPLYFGKLEINGRENIPKEGPYIIAPNHQNAFLDAILMGVYNSKPVHFLTRADVFVKPFLGALASLNMLPVYRKRDGYEKLRKNEETFAYCQTLLSNGKPVLIFPEGNMAEGHFLRPLTKGIARLALQTQQQLDDELMILPVGINYYSHHNPRYKCIINFGKPLVVNDYIDLYISHKAKGLIQLRGDLSTRMKELLLIPDDKNYCEKLNAFNRNNEHYNFSEFRQAIASGGYKEADYNPTLNTVAMLLAIFNPLSIGGVNFLFKNIIKEKQFTSSIKYILGLVLSVIWWVLLFLVLSLLANYQLALAATLLSIIVLFVRSWILKRSIPNYLIET